MNNLKQKIRQKIADLYYSLKTHSLRANCEKLTRDGLLKIGRHTYGYPNINVYKGSEARVIIGSFCSISAGVVLVTGGIHPMHWVSTFPFRSQWNMEGANCDGTPATKGDIVIGSDVWIGTDVMILSGVTIGHGVVVASRSVVTRDIPPYTIAAGNPARVIRLRFSEEVIRKLLELRWWEWDDDRIREAVPIFSSPNIDRFLSKYM